MNTRSILSILGFLIGCSGMAMLTGIPFSLFYGDDDIFPILISAGISAATGFGTWRLFKGPVRELGHKEGFLIAATGWIAVAAFGTLPYLFTGTIANFTDAFFETISGFSTTGASILTDVEILPHGVLFWRSMTHWIGGMGIIVLSLAVLPMLGIAGMQLYRAEAAGPTKDKLTPRIAETARSLSAVYVLLTFSEVTMLLFGGMPFFDAMCHSFGTIATGGFSTKNASIAYYKSPYIDYVIGIFMFLSAINFSLHYTATRGDILNYFKNSEFKFFVILLGTAVISITFLNYINQPSPDLYSSFRFSFFNVISISSCTGFATADFALWAPSAQLILLILMFIGGCAGSTAGAIKNVRILLLLRSAFNEVKKIFHPRAVIPVKFNGKVVGPEILSMIASFFMLYITVFALSSLALTMTGVDIVSAISGVASCMGGVGPGFNTVGPMGNYSSIPNFAKWILSFDMLLGRLELFTLMVIFTKAFWKI